MMGILMVDSDIMNWIMMDDIMVVVSMVQMALWNTILWPEMVRCGRRMGWVVAHLVPQQLCVMVSLGDVLFVVAAHMVLSHRVVGTKLVGTFVVCPFEMGGFIEVLLVVSISMVTISMAAISMVAISMVTISMGELRMVSNDMWQISVKVLSMERRMVQRLVVRSPMCVAMVANNWVVPVSLVDHVARVAHGMMRSVSCVRVVWLMVVVAVLVNMSPVRCSEVREAPVPQPSIWVVVVWFIVILVRAN